MQVNMSDAMKLIVKEIPEFSEKWASYKNLNAENDRSSYSDMDTFCDFTTEVISLNKVATLQRILLTIENLLEQGDDDVQGTIAIAFFENLTNLALNGDLEIKDFLNLLGPKSLKTCQDLDSFWGTNCLK